MADRNGYIGRAPGDSAVTVARQTFSPTGVTTDFTFASGYTVGYLDLFLNGTKLIEGVDYTATDTSTISLISAAINGDVLEGVAYKAFNLGDVNRIGIQSAGTLVGNVNTLNFVGAGNSILLNGGTIDVSISGGGGSAGAGGTWSNYDGNTGVTTTKKVKIQNDLEVTGVTTSTGGFVGALTGNVTGNIAGATGSFTGNVSVGGTLTYEDVTNIDSVGIVTARTGVRITDGGLIVTAGVSTLAADLSIADKIVHTGDTNTAIRFPAVDTFTVETAGSERLRVTSGGLVDISGGIQVSENVTPSSGSGIEIFKASSTVGQISVFNRDSSAWMDFRLKGNQIEFFTAGTERLRITSGGHLLPGADSTYDLGLTGTRFRNVYADTLYGDGSNLTNLPAAGLTTEALVSSGIVTTLNLTAAQDHKVTASGITTITVSGGTEAESHTVRIINSGITTEGFSTYFLFPSGSAPSVPTASGAISLISFTVNRVGAAGTQLLAGASVNFS